MKPQTEKSPLPFLLLLVCVLFVRAATVIDAPVVQTLLGSVSGQYVSVRGKEAGVHAYLGIPYGKPPVGPLRLSAPQPAEGWDGVRDCSNQPPLCIQYREALIDLLNEFGAKFTGLPDISEDCLYLNIYTPANRSHNAKLPVMVWIHGGGLGSGSASVYDGSGISAYQDMVVVLIQYRLGLLGYLSTGDEHIPGNFGMLDQVLALQWIQKHIHNFGGDPTSVTIFGESAGGVSVSLLLLSPLSDGLFHRAIAESGTAAMDMLVGEDPLQAAMMAANMSGCGTESTSKIASCLRNLDIDTIVGLNKNFRVTVNVDGHFLKKPVHELFEKHELLTLPFMTGVNSDEGGWLLPLFLGPPNWTEGIDKEQLKNLLSFFYPDAKYAHFKNLLFEEYAGTGEDRIRNRDALRGLLADLWFNIPVIKTVKAHRDAGAPVYLYQYHHAPSFLAKRPSFVGSDHGDEIFTVLGYCFTTTHFELVENCTEEDKALSRIMMNYWGNFARTGSPNGDGLVHWPQYSAEELYLAISATEQVTKRHLKQERFDYITQTLQEKIQKLKNSTDHGEL